MAKRQSKSGAKKKRAKKYRPLAEKKEEQLQLGESGDGSSGGGAMQGMVGGFRRAVGVEKSKKGGASDYIWTILLILIAAAILFWKSGAE